MKTKVIFLDNVKELGRKVKYISIPAKMTQIKKGDNVQITITKV